MTLTIEDLKLTKTSETNRSGETHTHYNILNKATGEKIGTATHTKGHKYSEWWITIDETASKHFGSTRKRALKAALSAN